MSDNSDLSELLNADLFNRLYDLQDDKTTYIAIYVVIVFVITIIMKVSDKVNKLQFTCMVIAAFLSLSFCQAFS